MPPDKSDMSDSYRDALLSVAARVMTFGGFQRTDRGEFWISRDSVIRCIDEELENAAALSWGPHAN